MKVGHQTRAFEQVLNQYEGSIPLHRFLLSYFKQHKQMGSSDRRWASRYIYSYFRLGRALAGLDPLKRLAIADFLCHTSSSLVINHYLEDLTTQVTLPLADKINLICAAFPDFKPEDVFPMHEFLAKEIDTADFFNSFFIQPLLFIRTKAANLQVLYHQLTAKEIEATVIGTNCLALPNGTKLDQVIANSGLYQVQDLSSQLTGNYFKPQKGDYWWDCCAASGGKSLLLHDIEPQIELLVSDVREKSLQNLDERFKQAGIKKYQKKVIDLLLDNEQVLHHYEFDGVLVDAPCSGSGTWGRTPEMLWYFEKAKIDKYVALQKAIAGNVIKYLKPQKPLIYMTCSVFKAENEEIVAYLLKNFDLKLEKMELIKGYKNKADSLFVARLIKQ